MAVTELPPVRPDLDTLLDAALKTGGETDAFDFKELLQLRLEEHRIRLVRAVGAFGNTDAGGHIWIGIDDDRNIVGLADEIVDLYDQTPIQALVNSYLAPAPGVQVRHHVREGKKLVVIEVSAFQDVPCIVRKSATAGKERLQAGTILFRNPAAESAVLTGELEMRKLCDAVANRRAAAIVELIQKGLVGVQAIRRSNDRYEGILALRERAEGYWSSAPGQPRYIEVFFTPEHDLALTPEQLRGLFPGASVPGQHGFPFYYVTGRQVYTSMPWGWLGAIPFSETPDPKQHPSYLWMLARDGSFLYREHYWEDYERSVIPGGVGIYHVAGSLIRLVRFLDRVGLVLKLADSTTFRLGAVLNNMQGRYLEDEKSYSVAPYRPTATDPQVEATLETPLRSLRGARQEAIVNLLEEVVWQFRRQDFKRHRLMGVVKSAYMHLGPEYALPETEIVPAP